MEYLEKGTIVQYNEITGLGDVLWNPVTDQFVYINKEYVETIDVYRKSRDNFISTYELPDMDEYIKLGVFNSKDHKFGQLVHNDLHRFIYGYKCPDSYMDHQNYLTSLVVDINYNSVFLISTELTPADDSIHDKTILLRITYLRDLIYGKPHALYKALCDFINNNTGRHTSYEHRWKDIESREVLKFNADSHRISSVTVKVVVNNIDDITYDMKITYTQFEGLISYALSAIDDHGNFHVYGLENSAVEVENCDPDKHRYLSKLNMFVDYEENKISYLTEVTDKYVVTDSFTGIEELNKLPNGYKILRLKKEYIVFYKIKDNRVYAICVILDDDRMPTNTFTFYHNCSLIYWANEECRNAYLEQCYDAIEKWKADEYGKKMDKSFNVELLFDESYVKASKLNTTIDFHDDTPEREKYDIICD